jgi:hypothetical protein
VAAWGRPERHRRAADRCSTGAGVLKLHMFWARMTVPPGETLVDAIKSRSLDDLRVLEGLWHFSGPPFRTLVTTSAPEYRGRAPDA